MVWVGSYAGLWCCGVDAIGDMCNFLLGIFVVVIFFAFVEYFLFPRVALCLFGTRPLCDGVGRAWASGYVCVWLWCTMLCEHACVYGIVCLRGGLDHGEEPLCY